jgi:septal ring factor EnvC (AmiA/AmiB activator)
LDLNFSAAEVAAVTALLGAMATALGFMTRNLLGAKQETIEKQAQVIARQESTLERSVAATAELRDVVKDQNRNVEGLRAQIADLLRELIDRRAVVNEALELWTREHGGGPGGRKREGR